VTTEERRRLLGAIVAMVWLVVLVVVDVAVTDPTLSLAPLFAIAPLIACAVLPAGPTAVFGVAALLLAAGSNQWNAARGTPQVWVRLVDIFLVSAAAVMVAWVRVRREGQLARVSRIAEVAQRTVLPLIPHRVGPLTAGSRYLSAAEDTLVGGDLYDWFRSDRRICFIVGDVRGKGVGAVEQAARVIRAFRQSAAAGADPAAMAAQMSAYLMQFFDDEEFATAVLVQITNTTRLTLVNCGHPAPMFIPSSGDATFVVPPVGLPLGLGSSYESMSMPWTVGDRLLLYTDGLSEARDEQDEYLPLLSLAPLLRVSSVEDALDGILARVREHVPDGQLTDDLAALLLENAVPEGGSSTDHRGSLVAGADPAPPYLPTAPEHLRVHSDGDAARSSVSAE
jgi:sigma-B regulation protein RsbU (phosphoserine phosphatase)